MSKSIVDKADVGSILVRVCEEELGIITPVCQQLGLPIPTHVIDVYKNRRSEYNQVKIWCKIDLGTCREQDLLITTGSYEPIDDFNLLTYSAAKRNSYTIEGTFDNVSEDANYASAATNSSEQNDRVDEEVIVEPKDLSLKPEEKPPFDGPVEMTDASGSTYIENELDFSKVGYKGTVRKGRFAF